MKFNIYTLGCKVNTYESNVIRDKLKNAGYTEVGLDQPSDISIINTCTVSHNTIASNNHYHTSTYVIWCSKVNTCFT